MGVSLEVVEVVGSIDDLFLAFYDSVWGIDDSDLLVDGAREGIDAVGVILSDFVIVDSSEFHWFVHIHECGFELDIIDGVLLLVILYLTRYVHNAAVFCFIFFIIG